MGVKFERHGAIARVVISRPDALNALDEDTIHQLIDAWRIIEDDAGIAVAVLAGEGDRAFCAGADLKTLLPLITAGGLQEAVGPEGPAFVKFIMSKPVVAAVKGICVAGGTELLQATDLRVVSTDARFGLAEPKWGLIPAGGSTVRLARQIPYCRAMEILLTGELIDAQEALRIGLVNRVVPTEQVDELAHELAERIASNGQIAVQAIKRSVLETWGVPLLDAFRIESAHARRVFASADAREGPRAFAEKRKPRFHGR